MVTEQVTLSKREYDFMNEDAQNLLIYGQFIANKKYPVAGYGFYAATVYKKGDDYIFQWKRGRSCD